MVVESDLQNRGSNIFAEIGAIFLTVYIHWSYLRVINNKLILIAIFAFVMINFLIRKNNAVRWSTFQNVFVALIMYCGIGLAYSPNTSGGIRFLLQLTLAFGICLFMSDDVGLMTRQLHWVEISGVISVVAIILQILFPIQMLDVCAKTVKASGYEMTRELYSYGYYSGLSGYNCIGGFHAASTMGIFFIRGVKSKRPMKRIGNYLIAVVSLFALIATQKRGVLLAAMIAVFFVLVYYFVPREGFTGILKMLLVFLLCTGIMYGILMSTETGQTMSRRFSSSDDISSGRFDTYQYILSNVEGYLLLGHGTGALNVGIGNDAHNIYLQILYDHGLLGSCIYIVFFATPLYKCVKKIKRGEWSENVLTSLFLQILFLCYGFTGNPLYDFCLFMLYLMAVLLQDIRCERWCF